MTEGTVLAVNPQRRFMGVQIASGISVVKILSLHKPVVDDVITGDLDQFGSVILENKSQHQHFGADVYYLDCDRQLMRQLMGL